MNATPITDRALEKRLLARLDRALYHALRTDGLFARPILSLDFVIVEDQECETAMTDGHVIALGRAYVETENVATLAFTLAHEAMHCMLRHASRHPSWCPDRIWNVATDLLINPILSRCGFTAPTWALRDYKVDIHTDTEEKIARRLMQECAQRRGSQRRANAVEPPAGATGVGAGSDKELDQQIAEQAVRGRISKARHSDQDGIGEFCMADDQRASDEAWEIQASAAWTMGRGSVAGSVIQRITSATRPRDVAQILAAWFVEIGKGATDSSYSEGYDVDMLGCGLYLPADFDDDEITSCAFVVDTSSSVDQKLLGRFSALAQSLFEESGIDELHYIQADSCIQYHEVLKPGDEIPSKIYGRGGTRFSQPLAYVLSGGAEARGHKHTYAEHRLPAPGTLRVEGLRGIVYFTDMEGDQGSPEFRMVTKGMDIPLLWAAYRAGGQQRWGRTYPVPDVGEEIDVRALYCD